jgi:hypothetical protein
MSFAAEPRRVDLEDASALMLVKQELNQARAKFARIRSLHEGYAVILEELDEFWQEVKFKGRADRWLAQELIQIAAMAVRTLVDCDLSTELQDG